MTTEPRGPTGRPRFQLKLALHSTLISSLVLIVSGGLIWHYTEQSHQAQLDRELSDLAFEMVASGQIDPDRSHEGAEQITFYDEELHRIGLLVQDHEHGQKRASPNWPEGLPLSKLPVPLEAKDYEPSRTYSHIVQDGEDDESHGEHAEHLDRSGHDAHRRPRAVQPRFVTIRHEEESWRVVGLRLGERTLHVAANLRVYRSNLNDIRNVILLAVILAMAVAAAGGWWLARRALQPVRTLTVAAEEITAADLARRIDDGGADREFARLIEVFNGMLERLESSFGQAVRFSADASHELKTPLTIMQGEVETALQSAPEGSAEQVALASQLEEIQRLKHLVRKLLLLSQADSGSLHPAHERLDLGALAGQVCEDVRILDPGLQVECRVPNGVEVEGDSGLLLLVLQNLASNAVRYNRPGGWVRWSLERKGDRAVLRAANSADPIPLDLHERVFDRFYRVDAARSGEGTGLGLSLAREIARAHGGRLDLVSSDEEGTVFELQLPARLENGD